MSEKKTLKIATWNILLDNTGSGVKPQSERLDSFAKAINAQDGKMDAMLICEAEQTKDGNNGHILAKKTGHKNTAKWHQHNDNYEYISFFGEKVDKVTSIPLDCGRVAVITVIDGIALIGVHLTYRLLGTQIRTNQISKVIEVADQYDKAIILGDFNSLVWQRPRRLIEQAGFDSAFRQIGKIHPITSPMKDYKKYVKKWQRPFVQIGFSVDDFYLKGLKAIKIDTMHGETDHLGLVATIEY